MQPRFSLLPLLCCFLAVVSLSGVTAWPCPHVSWHQQSANTQGPRWLLIWAAVVDRKRWRATETLAGGFAHACDGGDRCGRARSCAQQFCSRRRALWQQQQAHHHTTITFSVLLQVSTACPQGQFLAPAYCDADAYTLQAGPRASERQQQPGSSLLEQLQVRKPTDSELLCSLAHPATCH